MRRLLEHYRLPETLFSSASKVASSEPAGSIEHDDSGPSEDNAVDNLLLERYVNTDRNHGAPPSALRALYYKVRPLLSLPIRKRLQRLYFSGWKHKTFPAWPVDFSVESLHKNHLLSLMQSRGLNEVPFIWFWPDGHESCVIVTHDVETRKGRDATSALMDIDDEYGVKASFQVIPEERYEVPPEYLNNIRQRGFEINVHDLNHDGNLYLNEKQFTRRAEAINQYGREFQSKGFRAGSMYRNPKWFHALEFDYELSIPNISHFEPQQGGCCTVFPYFIGRILEIPLTTIQDYALLNFLQQQSIDLWIEQIELIRANNGLISILVHPDYLFINSQVQQLYRELLAYLDRLHREFGVLISTPNEVNDWWRTRNQLRLVRENSCWRIQGAGCERARIAYACRNGDSLTYQFKEACEAEALVP